MGSSSLEVACGEERSTSTSGLIVSALYDNEVYRIAAVMKGEGGILRSTICIATLPGVEDMSSRRTKEYTRKKQSSSYNYPGRASVRKATETRHGYNVTVAVTYSLQPALVIMILPHHGPEAQTSNRR